MTKKNEVTYPDVTVYLAGQDGNVYRVIGTCKQEIARKHGKEAGTKFAEEAMKQKDYDHVLQLCMRTVNVE